MIVLRQGTDFKTLIVGTPTDEGCIMAFVDDARVEGDAVIELEHEVGTIIVRNSEVVSQEISAAAYLAALQNLRRRRVGTFG